MKEFNNNGMGKCVLLAEDKEVGCSLIASLDSNQFIVAGSLIDNDGTWHWGNYYKDMERAVNDYLSRTKSDVERNA